MPSSSAPAAAAPAPKRPRKSAAAAAAAPQASASSSAVAAPRRRRAPLFTPFRALGYVCNAVPAQLQVKSGGKDARAADVSILTSLGTSWALWDAARTTLLFVGAATPVPIVDLALAEGKLSFLAAAGSAVYAYERSRFAHVFDATDDAGTLHQLASIIVFGDALVALSAAGTHLFHWSISTQTMLSCLKLPVDFSASVALHPAAYVDKVLLGSGEGALALYNIRTSSLLHAFPAASLRLAAGAKGESALVDLCQSPALDIVGMAWADGHVLVHDIRHDEPLLALSVDGSLARGCLAFRSDGSAHTLAVGTTAGDISLFDLAAAPPAAAAGLARPCPLTHTLRAAHAGAISSLRFVPSNPLLISSGADNAVRQWFFEPIAAPSIAPGAPVPTASVPRLLKSREGHAAPPTLARYYGEDGRAILSSGEDRSVRLLSVVRDSRSAEMSQGAILSRAAHLAVAPHTLKLPSATSLSFSTTRSRDWDDVLSTHAGVRAAHTWSARDRRMGSKPFSTDKAEATACCVSACGNFGLVGDAQGIVRAFNMQSGILRRTYAASSPLGMQKGKRPAAKRGSGSPVTGVVSDSLNSLVAVSTLDGHLTVYDFHTAEMLDVLKLDSPIASLALDRTTTLLATTHDDLTLRLIDLSTRRIVRQFAAFRARILDLTFSPDGRWLIVSSLDGVVRTYDVPSARLIDAFRPRRVATSVSFSPTSDFLATTHVGELGVYLWANRAQFSATAVRGMEEDEVWAAEAESPVALPDMRGEDADEEDDGPTELAEDGKGDAIRRVYTSPPQMEGAQEGALVTLTTMPRTRWMTLLNLDTIKRRNKPTEAPKKPERAPFFLPQVAGTELAFDAQKPAQAGSKEEQTGRPARPAFGQEGLDYESDFVRRLRSAQKGGDYGPFFQYLHTLSPPALDAELRSLSTAAELELFIGALTARLRKRLDYEAVQALLAVFVRVQADVLIALGIKVSAPPQGDATMERTDADAELADEGETLAEALRLLLVEQHREGTRVMELLEYCMGSLAFVRDLPLT